MILRKGPHVLCVALSPANAVARPVTVCCVPDMAKCYKVAHEGFIKFFWEGKCERDSQVNQSLVCGVNRSPCGRECVVEGT